jgi:hypothetical protein
MMRRNALLRLRQPDTLAKHAFGHPSTIMFWRPENAGIYPGPYDDGNDQQYRTPAEPSQTRLQMALLSKGTIVTRVQLLLRFACRAQVASSIPMRRSNSFAIFMLLVPCLRASRKLGAPQLDWPSQSK